MKLRAPWLDGREQFSVPGTPDRNARKGYLDGLRGIAAFVVVMEHLSAFLPVGGWTIGAGVFGDAISGLANAPFRSGTFSVYIFFVISGIVISASAAKRPKLVRAAVARYLRLTIPMVLALLFAAALFAVFPNVMPEIYAFHPNHWTAYDTSPPSVWHAFSEAAWGEYLFGQHDINSVIWSMRVELLGSIGLYAIYAVLPGWLIPSGMVCVAVILGSSDLSIYLGFSVGAGLFELGRRRAISISSLAGLATLLAGLVCGIVGHDHRPGLFFNIGAAAVVCSILWTGAFQRILEMSIPKFAGRISYSMYLIHQPLLYSAFAAMYLSIGSMPPPIGLGLLVTTFIGTTIVLAWGMTVWVDEPAARISKLV